MKINITAPAYVSNQEHYDFLKETIQSIKTKHEHTVTLVRNNLHPMDETKILNERLSNQILDNPMGNNVSSAWNQGIRWGLHNKCDYTIIANLDIILREDTIDNLVEFAEAHPEAMLWTGAEWTNRRTIHSLTIKPNGDRLELDSNGEKHDWEALDEHPHFSFFMVNKKGLEKLYEAEKDTEEPLPGYFDFGYKNAYFEDQDYHQRILRAGLKAYKCNSAIFYHYGSRTIKSDNQLDLENAHTYEHNRRYYEKKWGYDSHSRVPTNEERVEIGYKTAFNK